MAQLIPDLSPFSATSGGYWREIDVLQHLKRTLPDGYEVFHSVDWHSLSSGRDCHGEIDLVVMNQAGALLLVEVKAGDVCVRDGAVCKTYGQHTRQVDVQLKVQYGAMRGLLQKAGIETPVVNCLVLPDFKIGQADIVAIPRERIFDADCYEYLASSLLQLLPQQNPDTKADRVRAFLTNHLGVAQDVSVLHGQLVSTTRTLADGLATWVPRLQAPSNIYRIQATAGSGKTQLALKLLNDAASDGLQALYTCFNRPLADHIARLASPRVEVFNFHALCIDLYARANADLDFNDPDVFNAASAAFIHATSQTQPRLDVLLIDEAQDFELGWVEALLNLLKPGGRLYVLEDADQCLYPREALDFPEAVSLTCHDNFRSPRQVCQTINAFGLASHPIRARSPFDGEGPAFYEYDGSSDDLLRQTGQALNDLLQRGFAIEDIALLSAQGRKHSQLLNRNLIATHPTRRFTGSFDANGDPCWTDGELLLESVYRFKGQSAPAVILSEVALDQLTPQERAKLFVGMTRARMAVSLVLTHQAAAVLAKALDG